MSEYSPTHSLDNYHINLEARYASLVDENRECLHQLAAAKEQLIRIRNNEKEENQFLKDELKSKDEMVMELKQELNRCRKDLKQADKVQAENQKIKRANTKLKTDNENMEQDIEKMRNERRMLYEKVESINRSIKETDDKLKRKEKVLEDSQNQRWILERSNSELKLELEQMSKELEVRLEKIEELEECIQSNLQSQLNNANNNSKLINQINQLAELKGIQDEKINELEEQNMFLRQKLGQFEQQLKLKESQSRVQLSDMEGKMIDIKNVIETIGLVTEKTKTVRETKLRIQKDIRGALNNLERVIRSSN